MPLKPHLTDFENLLGVINQEIKSYIEIYAHSPPFRYP
jgi:hypothetical protein